MQPYSEGTFDDVAKYKFEQAEDDLEAAKLLLEAGKYKDTLSYFNKNYVHTEIFPRDIGRKISRLEIIRHKSDYDTFYIASKEDAAEQVSVAEEVIESVRKFLVAK